MYCGGGGGGRECVKRLVGPGNISWCAVVTVGSSGSASSCCPIVLLYYCANNNSNSSVVVLMWCNVAVGVQRGLVGDIISRFERKGFKLIGLKMMQCTKEIAEEHYKDLSSKPFFPDLVQYILSGPVVCMVWEGEGVVKSARKLIGATNPLESEPGTIRGDFAIQVGRNVVHGSDSSENGERETAIWFGNEGIVSWESSLTPWLIE